MDWNETWRPSNLSAMRPYYHVSPAVNRESIQQLGLRASDLGEEISRYDGKPFRKPRGTLFAIDGQPSGTYLAHDLDGAHKYARHVWDRFIPQPGGRLHDLDVWEVHLPHGIESNRDTDWTTPASYVTQDIAPEHVRLIDTISPER